MTTKPPRAYSDLPIPPGEVLAEEIAARRMPQRELAARMGCQPQVVNEIIRGKRAITPDTAVALVKVLGGDPQFWINLENDYQTTLAQQIEENALLSEAQWLKEYPVRELIKRGWLLPAQDAESKIQALRDFLGVATIEPAVYQEVVGFRITEAAQRKISHGALLAWLRRGELKAQEIPTADYDPTAFTAALSTIRGMTQQSPTEFVPAMTKLCADAGVAFCVVQELPKSGANGVARWLSDQKALLQMSIRNKWADIFWFSFFHEAGHLLKHSTQRPILIDGLGYDPDSVVMESEADQFARDFLIPADAWNDFCAGSNFAPSGIRKFANEVGVAPFMVVGRLQKEKKIPYNLLTSMKRRYTWVSQN